MLSKKEGGVNLFFGTKPTIVPKNRAIVFAEDFGYDGNNGPEKRTKRILWKKEWTLDLGLGNMMVKAGKRDKAKSYYRNTTIGETVDQTSAASLDWKRRWYEKGRGQIKQNFLII